MIKVLDQETINKIAAGEVVERPSSVVKELVENAIDAGATAVTVEIKDGGMSFIRITDNGSGIEKAEVPTAFIRHATSKIMTIEDLLSVSSLGFRGEALASISAVAQVELITKTARDLTGLRYEIHGGKEITSEEIGAPTGTTLIIRNLFYNVPARKKFLKTATTEGSYITELITRLALSKPEISFKYIMNGSNKIATSGNGKLKDVIYHLYGKDVSSNLLPVKRTVNGLTMEGYIGKAFVSKGNRSFEHYFVNGRYIRSGIVTKAIEEAYKSFVMIHKFPFTCVHLTVDSQKLDVNVHPTKMEFKYADGEQLFDFVKDSVRQALLQEEMIPDVSLRSAKEQRNILIEQQRKQTSNVPEPFEAKAREKRYQEAFSHVQDREAKHRNDLKDNISQKEPVSQKIVQDIGKNGSQIQNVEVQKNVVHETSVDHLEVPEQKAQEVNAQNQRVQEQEVPEQKAQEVNAQDQRVQEREVHEQKTQEVNAQDQKVQEREVPDQNVQNQEVLEIAVDTSVVPQNTLVQDTENQQSIKQEQVAQNEPGITEQITMDMDQFLSESARKKHRMIGQVFKTYWMIEYDDKLYMVDQHAAHEKVMFERLMKQMAEKKVISQHILPPKVVHLSSIEHSFVMQHLELFMETGFEIEDFGDDSIVIRSMPDDIMGVDPALLFDDLLNALVEDIGKISIDFFVEKLSGMACKAAIKGNTTISLQEADTLIDELLTLDNPYNCPHGRPTMVSLTKSELERKFKRIQN